MPRHRPRKSRAADRPGARSARREGMPQDVRISPDGKRFYVADMMADGVHVVDGATFNSRLHPRRHRHARPVPEPRRQEALRRQPRHRNESTASRNGPGSVSVIDFASEQDRGELGDSGRRQPRHGQRQRRRQVPVALGPLRRRRLPRSTPPSGEVDQIKVGREPTVSRCGRSRVAIRWGTRATCAKPRRRARRCAGRGATQPFEMPCATCPEGTWPAA